MLLSEIIRASMIGAPDLDSLMIAAEKIDVYVHVNAPKVTGSLVFIDTEEAAVTSIHPLTSRPRPAIKKCTQGQYWQLNHNPWLD